MSQPTDGGFLAALGVVVTAGISWLAHRISSRGEREAKSDMIATLQKERDAYREQLQALRAESEAKDLSRIAEAKKIARLESVNDFLQREIRVQMRGMTPAARDLFDTNFTELCQRLDSEK